MPQVADWPKNHRKLRKVHRAPTEQSQLEALSKLTAGILRDTELESYWYSVANDVCILAVRSALRIGKADQRNRTHAL